MFAIKALLAQILAFLIFGVYGCIVLLVWQCVYYYLSLK